MPIPSWLSKRFQTLIEQTSDSIIFSDAEGHIEYLNPAARRL